MIYIIEGPDGTGKTTLANRLAAETSGSVLHGSFDPSWDMNAYLTTMMSCARLISGYKPVIIDRWCVSEIVYGTVFRKKRLASMSEALIKEAAGRDDIIWIYCSNDNAVENHIKNREKRDEMYNDMTEVVIAYELYIDESPIPWIPYDYDKDNLDLFVADLAADGLMLEGNN